MRSGARREMRSVLELLDTNHGVLARLDRAIYYSVSMVWILSISSISLVLRSALLRASRRTATGEIVPVAILRDGRASKSAVADFDTLTLPKSGKPDFGERGLLRMRSEGVISTIRCDWFRGIDSLACPLELRTVVPPREFMQYRPHTNQ